MNEPSYKFSRYTVQAHTACGLARSNMHRAGDDVYVILFAMIESIHGAPGSDTVNVRTRSGDEFTLFIPFDVMLKEYMDRLEPWGSGYERTNEKGSKS